ncbi:methyltransferase domain-containing protein [Candidatus Uhrbacteria bacterium]|nr:methyltransferase domain-containing protein [Candidatus Uhrbacteria bacterium]
MQYSLKQVEKTYKVWGRYPFLYKLACLVTFIGQENKLRKLAIDALELQQGDTVLDLACGTGLNHELLEKAVGTNGKIIAFDYSIEMLTAAKQRAVKHKWNNIIFMQGDAAELSLDEKVDGVISTLGVSAIPQHKEALKRAVDVLKNEKRISILDAQLPTGFWKIFNPVIAHVYKNWASWDYTKKIQEDLFEVVGDVKIKKYNGGTIFIATGTKT